MSASIPELQALTTTLASPLDAVAWLSKTKDLIVLCPQSRSGLRGALYEAGPAVRLPYEATTDADLGLALLTALGQFRLQQRDLRGDPVPWHSFIASGVKSQSDFSRHFLAAQVTLSPSSLSVEVLPEGVFGIGVIAHLGLPDPPTLGRKVFHAYYCCRSLQEQGLLT